MLVVLMVAQPATAVLDYARGPNASACPDAESMKDAVSARLGYRPFVDDADTVVWARVSRDGAAWRGRIELRDKGGTVVGDRELTATGSDCTELSATMELAITIAIDPLAMTRPAATATSPESSSATQVAPTEAEAERPKTKPAEPKEQDPIETSPRPSPSQDDARAVRVAAGLGARAVIGMEPAPSAAVALAFDTQWGPFGLRVEGRVDLPRAAEVRRTSRVRAFFLGGAFAPCVHRGAIGACVLVAAGAIRASGEGLENEQLVTAPFFGAGGRFSYDVPINDAVRVRVQADLLAAITRTTLLVSDEVAWRAPPLSASAGADLLLSFF